MELLFLILAQLPACRADLVRAELMQRMIAAGYDPEHLHFQPLLIGGKADFMVRHASGRLLLHPLMRRRHASRRPVVPNRWTKRHATCARRMEHRRNNRTARTFIHAAPVAPAIRAPRVAIPPW